MAYKTVRASWLVPKFQQMLDQKWRYVANAAREGEADCSGAFTYWYQQAGSYMVHGTNSMIRKYSIRYGKIGEIELKPGMPVFRWSPWKPSDSDNQYYGDALGNFRHVGLYMGGGKTIEMKDTATGVYEGCISQWDYTAELKYTVYDLTEGNEAAVDVISGADPVTPLNPASPSFTPVAAHVSTQGGTLNLRKKPATTKDATILKRIPNETALTLTNSKPGWYRTSYDGVGGWVSADYITIDPPAFERIVLAEVRSEHDYDALINFLVIHDIDFTVEGGDD